MIDGLSIVDNSRLKNARRKLRLGTLHPMVQTTFDEIDPWWYSQMELDWHQTCARYAAFIAVHGRNPRVSSDDVDEQRLGYWLSRQRSRARRGEISDEHRESLVLAGGEQWVGHYDYAWDTAAGVLEAWSLEHPGQLLGAAVIVDGLNLSEWVDEQLGYWKIDLLTPARKKRLAACAAFPAPGRGQQLDPWQRGIEALRRWQQLRGETLPRRSDAIAGFPVGEWVWARQREVHRGLLTDDRIEELEGLPGWS